jgi:hypothetical protein
MDTTQVLKSTNGEYMTTITWTITELKCHSEASGLTNVVFGVQWLCAGSDGTYNSSVYGECALPPADPVMVDEAYLNFTPYAQLTHEQVLSWLWVNGVDKTATEAAVAQLIQNQINPPVVTPPLPWSN